MMLPLEIQLAWLAEIDHILRGGGRPVNGV